MARRRKKAGGGGGIALLFVAVVGLLAAVPKEVWIGAGFILAIGLTIYFYSKGKKSQPTPAEPPRSLLLRDPLPPKPAPARPPATATAPRAAPTPTQAPAPAAPAPRPASPAAAAPTTASAPPSPPRQPAPDVPVATARLASVEAPAYRVPPAPQAYGPGRWVPAGQSVEVAGVQIPGGMVYVGVSLSTPQGQNDPCLIDPSKAVASHGDYTERQMYYWPSYSEVSPAARRSYLNWLAGGRQDPEADVGFVFLFFYGLERRAIIDRDKDAVAQADLPVIAAEVRRLLAIYGRKSSSFLGYASSFLNVVELVGQKERLYEKPVPSFPRTFDVPPYVRLALGQAAVDGVPVPTHLALAWAKLDPNVLLRTPATRCSEEFAALFAQKYAEVHGKGMVLPRNKTKLKLVYQPASAGFRGYKELTLSFKETPDVTVLTGPISKLKQVVEAATQPLEAFSRMVGKDPDAKGSLEGLLQLPATLWPDRAQDALDMLRSRMADGVVALGFQEVLNALGAKTAFARDKTQALARALEAEGIGFEPDVLAGVKFPKANETVVLFAQPKELLSRADGTYMVATLTLQLASAVAFADGEFGADEKAHLRDAVQSWNHLAPEHTRRLLAHLELLAHAPASLTALKKKLEPLGASVKQTIATFMATVAQADGEVSPSEVKMLEKVYKALGIDANKVFSDVHAAAAGAKPAAATVAKVEATGFKLDPARIAALQQDTEKVSAMLANIFTEVEEASPASAAPPEELELDAEVEAPVGLLGLDETHTALARMLLSRPEWSREELMDIAADLDLMLDGALEHINEAAFDAHDMPFFEGDNPVTVNLEFLEKVEA